MKNIYRDPVVEQEKARNADIGGLFVIHFCHTLEDLVGMIECYPTNARISEITEDYIRFYIPEGKTPIYHEKLERWHQKVRDKHD